jgi:diguanylate cyclase (GGDEF)-like protein
VSDAPASIAEQLEVVQRALEVCRCLEPAQAAEAFLRGAVAYSRLPIGILYLYDSESDMFRLTVSTLPAGTPLVEELASLDLAALRRGGPPETWDPAVVPPPAPLDLLHSDPLLAVPLQGIGRLLGMLLLGAAAGGAAAPEPLARLRRLLPEMLPGLVNAHRVQQYRDLVIKDDQSDCYNRRFFDRCLSEEVYRAQRYGQALSLVFLDLDNLKQVNARHGHAAGSRTVREVSRRLLGTIRGSDRAFRYGGDEFCLVLPATDLGGARELCERLRIAIGGKPFVVDNATHLRVTASFGIATYPAHARTSLGLIKCADEAMQTAKGAGKNLVYVSGERGPSPSPRAQTAAEGR